VIVDGRADGLRTEVSDRWFEAAWRSVRQAVQHSSRFVGPGPWEPLLCRRHEVGTAETESISDPEPGLHVGWPVGRIPPEQTVPPRGRHCCHLLDEHRPDHGLTPGVPDQTKLRPAQHRGRLSSAIAGRAQCHACAESPGRRLRPAASQPSKGAAISTSTPGRGRSPPFVERVPPQLPWRHAGQSAAKQSPCTTHVENVQAAGHRDRAELIDHRIGISRPEPVVGLGLWSSNRPRTFPGPERAARRSRSSPASTDATLPRTAGSASRPATRQYVAATAQARNGRRRPISFRSRGVTLRVAGPRWPGACRSGPCSRHREPRPCNRPSLEIHAQRYERSRPSLR